MPAKTCVFTSVNKFDGDKFRYISSGEYIQMSGRAGRRGIDKRGICIFMVDEKMEPSTAKTILKGNADSLNRFPYNGSPKKRLQVLFCFIWLVKLFSNYFPTQNEQCISFELQYVVESNAE